MNKRDSTYGGERNSLFEWIDWELSRALENTVDSHFDGNCYLDLKSPAGIEFRIFVDCGGFDYFEWAKFPGGLVAAYNDPILRELEYHFDSHQDKLFDALVS